MVNCSRLTFADRLARLSAGRCWLARVGSGVQGSMLLGGGEEGGELYYWEKGRAAVPIVGGISYDSVERERE